jgi:hypothetical protein
MVQKVKTALRWPDDKVTAFDENGREISSLTGSYAVVRKKILELSDDKTVFRRAIVKTTIVQVNKGEW